MTITLQDVEKITKLSRIAMNDTEKQEMQSQLNNIFGLIDILNEVDVSGVDLMDFEEPQMHERADIVTAKDQHEQVVANAPKANFDMFAVPKVVE